MQVIVTKSQLEAQGPCSPFHLDSPEWDKDQNALVYADWSETVKRLSSSREGLNQLGWLVKHGLVPMTPQEFAKVRGRARREKMNRG